MVRSTKSTTLFLTIFACSILIGATTLYAQPDVNWNLTDTSNTQNAVDDCNDDFDPVTPTVQTNTPEAPPCQSYAADFYESLNPVGNGFRDADIDFFRVGADDDFFYFEFEMVESWNYDGTGQNRKFAIEIDVDREDEPDGLVRFDYVFLYDPLGNPSPPGHVGSTWVNTGENGDGKTKAFRDANNNYGGLGGTCDVHGSDFGDGGCTVADGYEADYKPNDSFYARILPRGTPTKNVIQLAFRRSDFVETNLDVIRSRGWSAQSSSYSKDKFPYHDLQSASTLGTVGDNTSGDTIDNMCDIAQNDCPESGDDPVPVILSFFRSTPAAGGIKFEWSTVNEVANVGFNIYAQTLEGLKKINQQLIPSKANDSLTPQDYSFTASIPSGAFNFVLRDVDIRTRARSHGPFKLGEAYGKRDKVERIDWAAIRSEHDALDHERKNKKVGTSGTRDIGASAIVAGAGPTQYPLSELRVSTEGIHRIKYEQLKTAGMDYAGALVSELALTLRGAAVPIRVKGSNADSTKFGTGGYIEFYGSGQSTLYTKANVFILQVNSSLATRVGSDASAVADGTPVASFYMENLIVDKNKRYDVSSPTGDPWYEIDILAFKKPVSKSFILAVDNLVSTNADSTLNVGLYGITDWPDHVIPDPDHHVKVAFNNVQVGDLKADGVVNLTVNTTLNPGVLLNGNNTLKVTVVGDTPFNYDKIGVDRYTVNYPRAFVARKGSLIFEASGEAFRVGGLTSAAPLVYRVEGANVTQMTALKIGGTTGNFNVTFAGLTTPAKYIVVSTVAVPPAKAVKAFTDIKTGAAQLLVISHPNFISGIQPLVDARQGQGYTVKVVDVNDIYAQFSHSNFDAFAIRDYVRFAAANLGTQYVMLVGGDTYDYHNYLGSGSISFIPTLYARTHELVTYSASDPLFTDLDGDSLPDLAIGRLPVRTTADISSVVQKTLQYPNAAHWRSAIFAADRREPLMSFSGESDSLVSNLPTNWLVDRAYLDQMPVASAKTLLINSINSGRALTSYFGHSGLNVWTFENLFTSTDAANLTNAGKPTVVTQYGCWNTYFVSPQYNTLGHKLLLSGDRGAAAVLGAATLTEGRSEKLLGQRFFRRLFQPGQTIGSALQSAKADLRSTNPELLDVLLGWTLLGDPTMVVEP